MMRLSDFVVFVASISMCVIGLTLQSYTSFLNQPCFLTGFCLKNKEILTFAALFMYQQNLS